MTILDLVMELGWSRGVERTEPYFANITEGNAMNVKATGNEHAEAVVLGTASDLAFLLL